MWQQDIIRFFAVREEGVIGEVDNVVVRLQAADFRHHAKAANAGIERQKGHAAF